MKVNFKELEDYLLQYGYPKNELMKEDYFDIPEMTAYEYTMENIRKYLDYYAMTYYGKKISYEDFAKNIDKTADAMKGLDLTEGQRVASLLPNIPEAAYMMYGPSKIGVSVSNIDPRTNSEHLLKFIEKEKIKRIVIVDAMYESAVRPIERQLKEQFEIENIIVVPATNSLPLPLKTISKLKDKKGKIQSDILEIIYWDDLIRNTKFQHATNVGYKQNREAVVQHSSGTSNGTPKSIPLTNENINSFVEKHRPTVFSEMPYGTRLLHILPYFASYGAINSAHVGFNMGWTLQEIPVFDFKDFGTLASKNKSEIIIGVPAWFNMMTKDKKLKLDKNSLSHVKLAISGGDSNNLKDKAEEDEFLLSHGASCIETNGHGMSELSGSGSYTFPGHDTGLSVGIPFPYDKYIVVDNEGNIVPMSPDGVKGEVYIYSPSATNGVFEGTRFAETKEFNGFRFLNSKDTMFIAPNYEISFLERTDRTFTRFDGHKIVPSDIETIIVQDDHIKQCMVVPYNDEEYMGKMPIAYVVPTDNLNDNEKYEVVDSSVTNILNSTNVTSREIPRRFCFLEELPKNKMNKNDYLALEAREFDGTEYIVDVSENNLSIDSISIIKPEKPHVKKLEAYN